VTEDPRQTRRNGSHPRTAQSRSARSGGGSSRHVLPGLRCAPADVGRELRPPCTLSATGRAERPLRRGIYGHGHGVSQRTERRVGERSPLPTLSLSVMLSATKSEAGFDQRVCERSAGGCRPRCLPSSITAAGRHVTLGRTRYMRHVHPERWRCIKIRPRRCLRGRDRDLPNRTKNS